MKEQRARVRECRPQLACSLQRLIVNNRHQPLVKFNCGVYVCVPCLSVQKSYFLRGSCSYFNNCPLCGRQHCIDTEFLEVGSIPYYTKLRGLKKRRVRLLNIHKKFEKHMKSFGYYDASLFA